MKKTIKDIAKEANVSITTVSFVLNNRPSKVSEQTKERILKIAKQYNYTPNFAAKSLVTKTTKTIGLVIPDIENPFFSSLSKAVEDYFQPLGYLVLLVNTNDLHDRFIKTIQVLFHRKVDGLLVVLANPSYQEHKLAEVMKLLHEGNVPIVLVDRIVDNSNFTQVYYDYQYGGYLATKHLIEHGHRKIGVISGPKDAKRSMDCLQGFYQAINEHQLGLEDQMIIEGDFRYDSGVQAMKQLLGKDITAVFALNNLMAWGAVNVIHSANKRIPEDYSLIGYDNFSVFGGFRFKLDFIEQDSKKIGTMSSQILYKKMTKETHEEGIVCLQPTLVINGSVTTKK